MSSKVLIALLRLGRDMASDQDDQLVYPVLDELLTGMGFPDGETSGPQLTCRCEHPHEACHPECHESERTK